MQENQSTKTKKLIMIGAGALVGIILILVVVMLVMGRRAPGGKDAAQIANAYVKALTTGEAKAFDDYVPNEAVNVDTVLERIEKAYESNSTASLVYDKGSYTVGDAYSPEQVEALKSRYGMKNVDEARDVTWTTTYKAVILSKNVEGEENVAITSIKVGDKWYYLDAKDTMNRYKKEGETGWTDITVGTVKDSSDNTDLEPNDSSAGEVEEDAETKTDDGSSEKSLKSKSD